MKTIVHNETNMPAPEIKYPALFRGNRSGSIFLVHDASNAVVICGKGRYVGMEGLRVYPDIEFDAAHISGPVTITFNAP